MKTYRRFIAMLLAGVLFLSCVPAHAMTTTEKENNYNAAILQLEAYLESYGNDSTELLGIAAVFEDLHGYAKSTSFVNYISVLMKIADGEYDSDMDFLLSMLEVNEGFKKYLEDMRNDSSIGTINELEAYARARECEHIGNAEAAMENYRQCLDFFDSQHRLTALYNAGNETAYAAALEKIQAGDYAGAYYAFSAISRYGDSAERMKAIVNLLGYTPEDASDNLSPATELKITKATINEMSLSWQKSSHAQQYEVYYKEANQAEWKHTADTAETTMTVTGLKQGTSYDFKVIAAIGRLKAAEAILTDQKTASVTPTPTPTPSSTEDSKAKYLIYKTLADGTIEITGISGDYPGVLEIPQFIDGKAITIIGNYAFSRCTNLTKVTIPDSVVSIGDGAFSRCKNLTNVTIPNGVVSIGYSAFRACGKLSSVTIPESVTTIGSGLFSNCGSLISVTIQARVTNISSSMFSNCSSLINVTIPDSVTSIGYSAFRECIKLSSVTIPDSVTTIENSAFYRCTNLAKVTIPNSVTSIGSEAFRNSGLTNVIISNSVTSIGDHAFEGCTGLTNVTIPNSVTSIGSRAFYECSSLMNIMIPKSVTIIEDGVFSFCKSLKEVTIPNSVTSIGSEAFRYSGLTSVTIPNSVASIGEGAFAGCSGLTNVTIPNSIISIESYAFSNCPNLTIYGSSNSTAENYAKENGIPFKRK